MRFALAIYVVGVIVGVLMTDARPLARIAIALAWPLGALAFAVTIVILIAAAMLVFPAFGLAVLAAAVVAWFASRG